MSFQERNITATLVSFTLICVFYVLRVAQLIRADSFTEPNVFRLWVTIIILGIVVTIIGMIASHIGASIVEAIKTNGEPPEIKDIQDERDNMIDLKGSRVAFIVTSFGVFGSMLSFALGQPALVMFSLLIFVGLIAQIIGDISRLYLYRRGF